MPMATWKLNIKNYFYTLANTHWQNALQCRISHQIWPVINNQKNLWVTQTQPHRVWHVDSSSYKPLACWRTCRQAKSPVKWLLQKLQGWGRSGNGRVPCLLLPSTMQTQTEILRKPLYRRSYQNFGD